MRDSDPVREDIVLEGIKVLDIGTFLFGPATATPIAICLMCLGSP